MVSTRFSALIFQTKIVTVTLPIIVSPPNNHSLTTKIFNFLSELLQRFLQNPQHHDLSHPISPITRQFSGQLQLYIPSDYHDPLHQQYRLVDSPYQGLWNCKISWFFFTDKGPIDVRKCMGFGYHNISWCMF